MRRDCPQADNRDSRGGGGGGGGDCYRCQKSGHFARDCPERVDDRTCYNCGQPGHISRDCRNERSDDRRGGGGGDRRGGGGGGGGGNCYKYVDITGQINYPVLVVHHNHTLIICNACSFFSMN